MGYRNYNGYGGGWSGGRWRSEAYMMDGGANDEGWYHAYCTSCGKETEHGRSEGCVPCGDYAARLAARRQRTGKQTAHVGEYTVTRYPNGKRYCTCKGFKFRKQCKHTGMATF